jgi:hypothetical protein
MSQKKIEKTNSVNLLKNLREQLDQKELTKRINDSFYSLTEKPNLKRQQKVINIFILFVFLFIGYLFSQPGFDFFRCRSTCPCLQTDYWIWK